MRVIKDGPGSALLIQSIYRRVSGPATKTISDYPYQLLTSISNTMSPHRLYHPESANKQSPATFLAVFESERPIIHTLSIMVTDEFLNTSTIGVGVALGSWITAHQRWRTHSTRVPSLSNDREFGQLSDVGVGRNFP
jgi:hypothetical protein